MRGSLAPVLLGIELGFLFVLTWRYGPNGKGQGTRVPIYAFLIWVTTYGVLTSILGARGLYISEPMLNTLPGLWLPLLTMCVIVMPILMSSPLRAGLRHIVHHTPWHWFAYFHGLRIAALGTAYKTLIGKFPVYFEYTVGLPDLLFGISALWIGRKAQKGTLTRQGFIIWNLIGLLIIVPATPILLQLGLPGPLQLITTLPDARAVLTYPMSIAPLIGVPLFVLVNLWVVWGLWSRQGEKEQA